MKNTTLRCKEVTRMRRKKAPRLSLRKSILAAYVVVDDVKAFILLVSGKFQVERSALTATVFSAKGSEKGSAPGVK